MSRTDLKKFDCSVAQTLDQIGEWWTLLILRDAFHGIKRFDDFQEQLEISPTVLSARLQSMTKNGILEKRKSKTDGRAFEYVLTEKGLDLYPVLLTLMAWGDKYSPNAAGPRMELLDKKTGRPIQSIHVLSEDGRRLSAKDVYVKTAAGTDQRMASLINYRAKA
ncbi:MAG: helix-turn-helix transcriptional regulator [Proteobacteria bacterium]|nr:helix-turn-helix transcriptional regulator [Pseudomonadota bacterium]